MFISVSKAEDGIQGVGVKYKGTGTEGQFETNQAGPYVLERGGEGEVGKAQKSYFILIK